MIQYVRGEGELHAVATNPRNQHGGEVRFAICAGGLAIITAARPANEGVSVKGRCAPALVHRGLLMLQAFLVKQRGIHRKWCTDVALHVLWRTTGLSQGLPQVSTCKGTTMSEPAPIHTGNRGVVVWCGSERW